MNEKQEGDVREAFEILGAKAATVDKSTFGIILRSLGMNPTNDEISELYSCPMDVEVCVNAAGQFKSKQGGKGQDKECVPTPHPHPMPRDAQPSLTGARCCRVRPPEQAARSLLRVRQG